MATVIKGAKSVSSKVTSGKPAKITKVPKSQVSKLTTSKCVR